MSFMFFFFNDTATTEIYTLSLHDALPISGHDRRRLVRPGDRQCSVGLRTLRDRDDAWRRRANPAGLRICSATPGDRKSTRLNSSHGYISYAVFCLKKNNNSERKPKSTAYP